jgi:phosphorylase kinase alpha/beta subunit
MQRRVQLKFNHRRSRLDDYYNQAETIILTRQDPVTGLLPAASTAVTVHGDYSHAWVHADGCGRCA